MPPEGVRLAQFCDFRDELEYTERAFPGRTAGLRPDMSYDGCAESFGFRAGSYSGHNAWRDKLATMAGLGCARALWENLRPGPFVELIDFSDCEGLIGPEVSAKLAKDFADHEERAAAFAASLNNGAGLKSLTIDQYMELPDGERPDLGEGDCFLMLYREWRRAFEWAADNGMVSFH